MCLFPPPPWRGSPGLTTASTLLFLTYRADVIFSFLVERIYHIGLPIQLFIFHLLGWGWWIYWLKHTHILNRGRLDLPSSSAYKEVRENLSKYKYPGFSCLSKIPLETEIISRHWPTTFHWTREVHRSAVTATGSLTEEHPICDPRDTHSVSRKLTAMEWVPDSAEF